MWINSPFDRTKKGRKKGKKGKDMKRFDENISFISLYLSMQDSEFMITRSRCWNVEEEIYSMMIKREAAFRAC